MLILAIIVAIIGLVLLPVRSTDSRTGHTIYGWKFGIGFLALALFFVFIASLTVVGTRNVGVVTSFGKPTGRTLGNGLHMKAPWQKVTDIDGTIHTQKFVGDSCIDIRISDGSTACVSVVIRTRIDASHADEIYRDYRNSDKNINDNVNDALVRTQLTSALATVFADFNPLLVPGSVDAATSTDQAAPNLQEFSANTKQQMENLLSAASDGDGPQVDISSITLSYIKLSESTQNRLNQLQAEVAQTRIARQKQATAAAQAKANEILSNSLSKDPNVLVSRCFDLLGEAIDKGHDPNTLAFNCWSSGNTAGVVVPTSK
jgi:regulator of protease activity HflC (stomatin/prohibitin superfamily)